MTVNRVERRIAAILAADVVGYSQLMAKDEEATPATLKQYRSAIETLIGVHRSRLYAGFRFLEPLVSR